MFRNIEKSKVIDIKSLIDSGRGQTISSSVVLRDDLEIFLYSIYRGENISDTKIYKNGFIYMLEGRMELIDEESHILNDGDMVILKNLEEFELIGLETSKYLQVMWSGKDDEIVDLINNIDHAKVFKAKDIIDYRDGQVANMTLTKRDDLNLSVIALDEGEMLSTHSASGDAMVVCIDGEAEIRIADESFIVKEGDLIILPKDIPHSVKANKKYKMILTVVK